MGINPLIKLGKEFLTSNNTVHVEDCSKKEKEIVLKHDKKLNNKVSNPKLNKKVSTSNKDEKDQSSQPIEVDPKNKLPNKTNDIEEIELTDDIENTRRTRRRSSANNE